MTTLPTVELGVLGPLQVRKDGAPVAIPGAKPRAILTMLGLHSGSVVSAVALFELLWGTDQPRTADKALQTHISSLRRTLGDGVVLTAGAGWTLAGADVDAERYKSAAKAGRDAAAAGDTSQAAACFEEALTLWRGIPELPDSRRGASEKTRWIESHAALVEDRADALLATGRAAEIIGELEAAVAEAPLRERRWGQLMLALYRAGRQGEALGAYRRARSLLADELGVDPGPELRRLEAAIVAQDAALDTPGSQQVSSVTRAVTFLLTDIEGSTAAWEADAGAMGLALARHDEIVEQVVTSRGGRLIKTRGEGDATFSVFERPSGAAAAAIELQDAITYEPWALREPMRIRVALHTGEVELRDGDYFGRAVNRVARLRSLAAGGQILCSGATAELVIDSLPDDVVLADLGLRQLRNLARPEHVFELRADTEEALPQEHTRDAPIERPALPTVLAGPGPFVGRGRELERLLSAWQIALASGTRAVLIAGEPGVGKTRLAGEWARQAYEQGAVVLYGRCDEDLGAPYQPFAEALRLLVPCLGTSRLRGLRGVEALLPLVPVLTAVLPDLTAPARADPDTERYALFDAVVALLEVASAGAPVVLVLDDLHWAAKPTLLLLRHLLRFGEHARVQIVGTYRSTDLDRSHPLAAMLADLHRDGTANRISLSGLDEDDVTTYVAEAGYDDEELARALASVTGGNPFFLIEALRHVDESGGVWDPSTLPQGVREAVSRRLSRLPAETNKALAAAAVVGSRFAVDLVERVVDEDLVDAFDEASKAGIVIEEPGGYYRFNHAIVRQSLLAELASVRRMRLHQRIAATLETQPGADDELLAELAYHYFECAWAGNASKAVYYCRRAADQAMARLAYEGAADLYDRALHALEEIDEELPDREDQTAELLVARCEALLAAGDVASAAGAVSQLQEAAGDSARLTAWATCFDGQLTMLVHPERLDEVEAALGAAADKLAELGDAAGEAKAHTERAACLGRLGRVADCEIALDNALTAARRAREHRRVNEVLAGAPLAALWGPNPVPRAGGRCLDVVRLLRITTDSPAVEATSTRCQAVLEAFRGRAAAAQRMIDSARRTVTELGLRHALLEVEQFAGIVELVADDPAAAEPHLRQAYNGFRRMGLDADTAETAALLARACLALGRDDEADEFCSESERLAGHALKASIAWRAVRAQLLARRGEHVEARRVAEAAVALAERTDALVDHGDACLALATVLDAAGDVAAARAAAERAVDLYERKGAAALADKARGVVGVRVPPAAPAPSEAPVAELENACVRTGERLAAAINCGAFDQIGQLYAPEGFVESRRKPVGFTQTDLPPREWSQLTRRVLETGDLRVAQVVIAVRGERLALSRLVVRGADADPGAPQDEFLQLYGIDDEGRVALQMWFDIEDVDAAIAELDAAYARFEAPTVALDNACVRVIRQADAAFDREDWDEAEKLYSPDVFIESRRKIVGFRRVNLRPDEFVGQTKRFIRDMGAARGRRVAVAVRGERLALTRSAVGTKDESPGAPQDEMLQLFGLDEQGRIELQVWFDVDDLEAAIAELETTYARFETSTVALDNACVQAVGRLVDALNRDDWEEVERIFAVDVKVESRRKIVGFAQEDLPSGGWTHHLKRVSQEIGEMHYRQAAVEIRGEQFALFRVEFGSADTGPGSPQDEMLHVVGLDELECIASVVWFDVDDMSAALTELDAIYARFEAQTVALDNACVRALRQFDAALQSGAWNEFEQALAPDFAVENRRKIVGFSRRPFEPNYVAAFARRLREEGAKLDRRVVIATRGDRHALTRVEVGTTGDRPGAPRDQLLHVVSLDEEGRIALQVWFDVEDLDAAMAELDAQHAQLEDLPNRVRLENAATRVNDRIDALFAESRWDQIGEMLADEFRVEDRRQGLRRVSSDRATEVTNLRAMAETGVVNITTIPLAQRGNSLCLSRVRVHGRDTRPEAFHTEALSVVEVNSDEMVVARIIFEPNDFEAAIAELDARFIAGEAAAHAHTWSLVTRGYAALNRQELPPTTPDLVSIDHRRGPAFAEGDLIAFIRATWDLDQDKRIYIETVHRLSDVGSVLTHVVNATSQGFDAEWRVVVLLTAEGDSMNRCELFDEADLSTARARFDELRRPIPRLENATSQAYERLQAHYAAGAWDAIAETLADDIYMNDRRRVVGAGVRRGRDDAIADMRSTANLGITNVMPTILATRGDGLVLVRASYSVLDQARDQYLTEVLNIFETDADGRIAAGVVFDSDDIDAAFEELDARYLAGEAAPYARVWQSATDILNAVNRHERGPAVADLAYTDHRRIPFVDTDFGRAVSELWDLVPDARYRVTTVHALAAHAVVASIVIEGTDVHGSELQWARTILFVADGQRLEVFEEDDVDVALRRFEELRPRAKQLANASSRAYDHQKAAFAARDWDALAAILAEEVCHDDRRRVVNSGVRRGRDAVTEEIAGILEIGVKSVTTDTIATRGENLVLSRAQTWGRDQGPEAFHTDVVDVVETDAEGRIVARVVFDPDDIDAAFEELDSRYLVAEAAPYAHTWSLIARAYAGFNRREIPAHTKDWVNIDHRHAAAMAPGEGVAYFHASWELAADLNVYIEAVHRLSDRGAVFTHAGKGISREGFEAEWRTVDVVTVEGDLVSRVELFDEADVDDALARFDELQPQTRRLENAASRVTERYWANFATRDWDAIADMLPDSFSSDDRRRMVGAGVRRGRDAEVADLRAIADLGLTNVTSTIIATRGQSLILGHARFSGPADRPETAVTEILGVIEVDADQQITATVVFDPDDIDAAFDELDARYLSGEAAPYAHTWSAITAAYWAVNRREPFATTPDWVNVDHRRGIAFAPGQMIENMRAQWDLTSHISYYVEAVHRLRDLGAVVTRAADGTSREGFDAEWRVIDVLAFEGDMVRSCETFDEADLDAALAKFDGLGRGVPRLENAASQVVGRYQAHFAARDWNAMEQLVADDMSTEDRRRIVNGGVLRGRDIEIANVRTLAELGGESITSTVLATRGDRLVLACTTFSSREWPDSFEIVDVVEINPDNQLIAHVMFDANDIGAAFEELDTRYLAGETAAQSHTWSVITQAYAALNRRQLPATTPDWVNVDHRRFGTVETNGLTANIRAWWDLTSEATMRIEAVLRLSDFGAVVVHATQAAWQEGVEIESREVSLLTVTGEKLNRCEIFDEADADAALTRFDELHSQGCRLENAASQKWGRLTASFAARDWADIADTLADDFCSDDRRRIVNAGIRRGRDTNIADTRAVAEVGVTNIPFAVIATRGDRLALLRSRLSGRDPRPEAYHDEVFQVVEVNADNRIATVATFDGDDIDAAFAELNARYLAGEAAAHAHAWSVIAGTYAAFNRHELPTAAWFNVDHRRGTPFASSNLMEFIRGVWEVTPDLRIHIEAVHRLSDFGAVVTHSSCGTSREGFHAEWRMIQLLTVEGDRVSRCELFDETDLDAALARFEELQSQPRLNNAASRVYDRYRSCFAARDWAAMAEMMAPNTSYTDSRHVVNVGFRQGRDTAIGDVSVLADIGVKTISSDAIATRGERFILSRIRAGGDQRRGPFQILSLDIVEIDASDRIVGGAVFDVDDIDAAFAELDARYLAGEAAAHAHTWSVIMDGFAALNRHELPRTTADSVDVDHRRGTAFAPGDLFAYLRATWELTPNRRHYIEAVHRLSDLGAVCTAAAYGTSQEGFDAEWRMILILAVEGDLFSRGEVFEETDLDAALQEFDELNRPVRKLETAASQVLERVWALLADRDWVAITKSMADDFNSHDHRRVVNAGVRRGRDVHIENMRAVAEVGFENLTSSAIATRGERLALSRVRSSVHGLPPGEVSNESLSIVEIDAENRLAAHAVFDVEDIDAAFAELDSWYLTGEAAAHSQAWSVIAGMYAGFNRGQRPATTPDWVKIDHRSLIKIEPGDLSDFIGAVWDLTPELKIHMETVHRLNDLGAVVTHTAHGLTREGFDAEWRMIAIVTVDGDRISRWEIFDEAELDAALQKLDELNRPVRKLENAASQEFDRFSHYFSVRDWASIAEMLVDDYSADDRRPVVNAGFRRGRDAAISETRAIADSGTTNITSTVIATRGQRLALCRTRVSGRDERPEAFHTEALNIIEMAADNRFAGYVSFGTNEIDAAFEELDARYIAGEAAPYAHIWSVIKAAYTALNRRELFATTPDCVFVDHRRGTTVRPGDMLADIRATWEVAPNIRRSIEAAHRLSGIGAVITHVAHGTSQEGFDAEWRLIALLTVAGDQVNRCELFDEEDLDAALARFDELNAPAPLLDNAASRLWARTADAMNRHDLDDTLAHAAADARYEDRRKGLRDEGPMRPEVVRALFEASREWLLETEPVAIRGDRLVLSRDRYRDTVDAARPVALEHLTLMEVDENNCGRSVVLFDPDDINGAMAELTTRWIASGEVAHPDVIQTVQRLSEVSNRHDWDAVAASLAGATYVSHRQLAHVRSDTTDDYLSSIEALASLVPDYRADFAEILSYSSNGLVAHVTVKGTSIDGLEIEIPLIQLGLLDGERVTRIEFFDPDQRELALTRFEELCRNE